MAEGQSQSDKLMELNGQSKQVYCFPDLFVSVEAYSLQEALRIVQSKGGTK